MLQEQKALDTYLYKFDQTNSEIENIFKEILTQKALSNKNKKINIRKSPAWLYPIAIEKGYERDLKKIMAEFTSITIEQIKPLLSEWVRQNKENIGDSLRKDIDPSDELEELNNQYRIKQEELFVLGLDRLKLQLLTIALATNIFNKNQWQKILRQSLQIEFNVIEPWVEPITKAWVNRNVNLIKGLTDDYIKQINEVVLRGFNQGITADELARNLTNVNKNFTKNRTRLIARDQLNKLNGVYTRRRQLDAGVDKYIWRTSGDERVRSSHRVMNGKICRWDDPTVYADSIEDANVGKWKKRSSIGGVQLHPQFEIQCRCNAEAIFKDTIEEVENKVA